jgi:hypothetical protein
MAVRTQQPKVLKPVVERVAVDVVELENERFLFPSHTKVALGTLLRKETGPDHSFLERTPVRGVAFHEQVVDGRGSRQPGRPMGFACEVRSVKPESINVPMESVEVPRTGAESDRSKHPRNCLVRFHRLLEFRIGPSSSVHRTSEPRTV